MNATITKQELIERITLAAGPLSKLARKSKATKDSDNVHPKIQVAPGLTVGWVSNPNYCGGTKNGYGPGLYAYIMNCGTLAQNVKIA